MCNKAELRVLYHGMKCWWEFRTKNICFSFQKPQINQGISSVSLAPIKRSPVQSNYCNQADFFPCIQTWLNCNCKDIHPLPVLHCFQKNTLWMQTSLQPLSGPLNERPTAGALHRQTETETTAAGQSWANNAAWLPDLRFHSLSGETMPSLFSPGSSHRTPIYCQHAVTCAFSLQ